MELARTGQLYVRSKAPGFAALYPGYVTFAERIVAYREWLHAGISEDDLNAIRNHLEQERVLGSERFQKMVEKTLNRAATFRPRGRPRAKAS